MAFFAVLAATMVVASYTFVLLLAAVCVYLPYFFVANSESLNIEILGMFLFGIVIAATMLWSLIPRREKFEAPGMLLDRAAHPRLFAELESIANALNEPLPREVYLIGAPNAFVADRGGVMGFGSRRIMGLGLPLLSLLTVSQFRAVLAHEFAHYYGGDTSLGPWVYKTKTSIVRVFENIGSVRGFARIAVLGVMYALVTTLLKWYFITFLRVIHLISRKQEYRADELACLIAGRQNLIDGLQSIHRAAVSWTVYWKQEIAPRLGEGSLPAVGDGFQRFVVAPAVSSEISKNLSRRLQEQKTQPYDTHPPLRDRIRAARNVPETYSPQNTEPASSLLDNLPATELQFVETCVPDIRPGSLKHVAWNDVASQVTIPSWQKFVKEYSEPLRDVTAGLVPDYVSKFPEIGSRIRDPKGMLLSPPQRTARAGRLFASALALAMIRHGWELQVQPAAFRMGLGDEEFNPFGAIDKLMSGKLSREEWQARCRELGISDLFLLHDSEVSAQTSVQQQAEVFSVGISKA
jgi:Zn-dependent protease with chaperone function